MYSAHRQVHRGAGDRRVQPSSRGGKVRVITQRRDERRMGFSWKQIAQQLSTLALGHCENSKTKIDYVDRSTIVKMPTVTNGCRKRHLARTRHQILLNGHQSSVLGTASSFTKCDDLNSKVAIAADIGQISGAAQAVGRRRATTVHQSAKFEMMVE